MSSKIDKETIKKITASMMRKWDKDDMDFHAELSEYITLDDLAGIEDTRIRKRVHNTLSNWKMHEAIPMIKALRSDGSISAQKEEKLVTAIRDHHDRLKKARDESRKILKQRSVLQT